ncbi:DUF58 domain-containing protein [Methyloferula stellata]|uniref:DUF58 domain-containing protein n=1 Tax=Methyloferula stellata TaxID=876270 RepID=UPI000381122C|nr:DUF58 domain-containing protein [Methyloferula stellata]
MTDADEITYRPHGKATGVAIGAHRGRDVGGIGRFYDQVPYLRYPDPRRIDINTTVRDPYETIYVRRFEQRTAISVYAVIDLSASMSFEGMARKKDLIARLCLALARSTHRLGDGFGVIGCDEHIREDFFFPATRRKGFERDLEQRFAGLTLSGRGAQGLAEAADYLGAVRSLVFLISDFRMPLAEVEKVLRSLGRHDVAPIVVSDSSEETDLPRLGLIEMRDLESGKKRFIFMRPSLRRRWLDEASGRRQALRRLFSRYGRLPFELIDRLDADRLSRHLLTT